MEMQDGIMSGYAEYDEANADHKMDSRAEEKVKELVANVLWSPTQESNQSSMFTPWLRDEYETYSRLSMTRSTRLYNVHERSIGLNLRQGDTTLGNNAVYQMATMDKLVFHELLEESGQASLADLALKI